MRDTVKQRIEHAGFPSFAVADQQQNAFGKTHQQGRRDHHPRPFGE